MRRREARLNYTRRDQRAASQRDSEGLEYSAVMWEGLVRGAATLRVAVKASRLQRGEGEGEAQLLDRPPIMRRPQDSTPRIGRLWLKLSRRRASRSKVSHPSSRGKEKEDGRRNRKEGEGRISMRHSDPPIRARQDRLLLPHRIEDHVRISNPTARITHVNDSRLDNGTFDLLIGMARCGGCLCRRPCRDSHAPFSKGSRAALSPVGGGRTGWFQQKEERSPCWLGLICNASRFVWQAKCLWHMMILPGLSHWLVPKLPLHANVSLDIALVLRLSLDCFAFVSTS